MDRYQFGNNLCSLRESNNLTQRELAQKLNVSDKAISKWENGKSMPKFELLEEMAKIFNVELIDLLCLSPGDSDYEIERLRLSVSAQTEKSERIKNAFIWVLISFILVTFLACVGSLILYLILKKDTFLNMFNSTYSNFYLELGFIAGVSLIKSFVFENGKNIINYFKTPSNCVVCQNVVNAFFSAIHYVSVLFAIFFVFIASTINDNYMALSIVYLIIIALLLSNFVTQKYANDTIVLTGTGFFKESIERGEYHSYSEITDFTSNAKKIANGLASKYVVRFFIGKEKYKLYINDPHQAMIYFGDTKDSFEYEKDDHKLKPYHFITIALSIVIMLFGMVMFYSNSRFGGEEKDYTTKLSTPSPLTGQTSVAIYKDRFYAYSENQCTLNVFDKNGDFEFAINIPTFSNGMSYFFIKNDSIFIVHSWRDKIYKFDSNGNYLGRTYEVSPDEKTVHLCIENSIGELYKTVIIKEDIQGLLYFDNELIQYEIWDDNSKEKQIATYNLNTKETTIYNYDNNDESVEHLDGVVFVPYDEVTKDADGNDCYIFLGALRRGNEILYRTPFFDWYKNTAFACWLTFAFGMITTALQLYVFKRNRYKRRKNTNSK